MSAFLVVVALAAAASKAPAPPAAKIEIVPAQGNVYLLAGGSRNVAVQVGNEGVLYVDSSTADMSEQILKATRTLSQRSIRYVINTHAHPENVGGNQALSRQGISFGGGNTRDQQFALILAHENVLNALSAPTGQKAALASDFWPTDTYYTASMEVYLNGEPVELINAPEAHTDGDSMVHFRSSDVIVTGDVFLTTGYPRNRRRARRHGERRHRCTEPHHRHRCSAREPGRRHADRARPGPHLRRVRRGRLSRHDHDHPRSRAGHDQEGHDAATGQGREARAATTTCCSPRAPAAPRPTSSSRPSYETLQGKSTGGE